MLTLLVGIVVGEGTVSRMLAFTAVERGAAVWLLDLETGAKVPVSTRLSSDYGFDRALGRRGWVAAHVGYQVGAFADGSLADPVMLPWAWQMYPAASDDLVLLRLYHGDSSRPGDKYSVAVVGPNGRVHRSAVLPWGVDDLAHLAGEVDAGVVTWAGIAGWDDSVIELPTAMTGDPFTDPRPFAVLAGRVILFEGVDYVEAYDTRSGRRRRLSIPPIPRRGPFESRFGLSVTYNDDGTWLYAGRHPGPSGEGPGAVVAGVDGELRWLGRDPGDRPCSQVIWSGERLLIADYGPVVHDPAKETAFTAEPVYYHPATGSFSVAAINPIDTYEMSLRLDVTGRFTWPA